MVSLIDIVPQTRTVRINGGSEVELRGLGVRQIAGLLLRFPELRKLFANGAPALDFEAVAIVAPDAIGNIIAEAARQPDAADNIADAMSLDDCAECMAAVIDLTMPDGFGPFMEKLGRLIDGGAGLRAGRAAATNTPPPPSS
jgi:hypothetical protein